MTDSTGQGSDRIPQNGNRAPDQGKSALVQRLISASVLGPVALGASYLGGAWFVVLLTITLVLMCFEWGRMVEGREFGRGFFALATGGVSALVLGSMGLYPYGYLIALVAAFGARLVYRKNRSPGRWAAFGSFYLVMPCLAMLWLRQDVAAGRELLFLLFAVVWSSDSMAFLTGRLIGGPKLSPTLSPAKTWSGAIGGAVAGGFAGLVASEMVLAEGAEVFYWLVGACLGLMSIIGDLAESAFKRVFRVKDISGFIPGHGGVLDRLDGMIFAGVAMTTTLYLHIVWNSM